MTRGVKAQQSGTAARWALAVLALIAGTTLFGIAGGIWFDLAETDAPADPWPWLTGGGVLIAVAGFIRTLLLASNAVVRRQRLSILVDRPGCTKI